MSEKFKNIALLILIVAIGAAGYFVFGGSLGQYFDTTQLRGQVIARLHLNINDNGDIESSAENYFDSLGVGVYDWKVDQDKFMLLNMPFDSQAAYFDDFSNNYAYGLNYGVTLYEGGANTGGPCLVGTCLHFNGSSGYVELQSNTGTNSPSSEITLEAWYYPDGFNTSNQNRIISKGDSFVLFISDTLDINFHTAGTNPPSLLAPSSLVLGAWNHIVGTYDGSNKVIYLNGAPIASIPTTGDISSVSQALNLGANNNDDQYTISGYLDEVKIYTRSLSADQVSSNHSDGVAGVGGPTKIVAAELKSGEFLFLNLKQLVEGKASGPLLVTSVEIPPSTSSSSPPTGQCTPAPPNLISSWLGEGDSTDSVGDHDLLAAGTTLVTGKVGQAFSFDGVNDFLYMMTPVDLDDDFTFSTWIKTSTAGEIISKGFPGLACSGGITIQIPNPVNNVASPYPEEANKASDDNRNSFWNGTNAAPGFIYFDLDAIKCINQIQYFPANNPPVANPYMAIQISDDATNWTTVVSHWKPGPALFKTFDAVSGRYVKLVFETAPYISEFTAYVQPNFAPENIFALSARNNGDVFSSQGIANYNAISDPATSSNITDNQWHLISVSKDNTGLKLYIDGLQSGSDDTATAPFPLFDQFIYFGRPTRTGAQYFSGQLDEMHFFDRALTDVEQMDIFTADTYGLCAPIAPSPPPSSPDLILDIKLDNDVNPQPDDSGYGNNGTVLGPTHTTTDCVSVGCLSFDGTDDYIALPNSIDPVNSPNGFSISAWARADDLFYGGDNKVRPIVFKRRFDADEKGWRSQFQLILDGRGGEDRARFYLGDETAHSLVSSPIGSVQTGLWYHVVGVYDPALQEISLYLNGQLQNSVSHTSLPADASSYELAIGRSENPDYFDGNIDEVQIYSRVLTEQEISDYYNATLPPPIDNCPGDDLKTEPGICGCGTPETDCSPPPTDNCPQDCGSACFSEDMVAFWKAEGSGLSATDSRGPHTGTLVNGLTRVVGKVSNAFQVNVPQPGIGEPTQYIEVPNTAALSPAAITVETWIKVDQSSNGNGMIVHSDPQVGVNTQIGLNVWGLTPRFGFTAAVSSVQVEKGQWYHLAGTSDGSTSKIYVNGVETGSGPSLSTILSSGIFCIGGGCSGVPFSGLIDEVSVYNRALLPEEISTIYNQGLTGLAKCGPLFPDCGTPETDCSPPPACTPTAEVCDDNIDNDCDGLTDDADVDDCAPEPTPEPEPTPPPPPAATCGDNTCDMSSESTTSCPQDCGIACPTDSMVSWWKADGTADDSFGAENGTLELGASTVPGYIGSAFNFDGTDDYVNVPDSPTLDAVTSEITVSAWIYPDVADDYSGYIFSRRDPGVSEGFSLYVSPADGMAGLAIRPDNNPDVSGTFINTEPNLYTLNEWTHIAASYSETSGLGKIYINGAQVNFVDPSYGPDFPFTGPLVSNNNLFIGRREAVPEHYRGLIDDLQLYDRELTSAEISAIYSAGSSGICEFFCGDAIKNLSEECDGSDGVPANYSCTSSCTLQATDLCPDDAKTEPGVCGCDTPDDDTDNDGTLDCNDQCPDDPDKVEPGDCDCGAPDTDLDNNGTSDCLETPETPSAPSADTLYITTVAGGETGDGSQAVDAVINYPYGVAVDGAGNVYIVESGNHRIRKVDTAGKITTVAGNGTACLARGLCGDGGQATSAALYNPYGVAIDGDGNIYIADSSLHRIRKVNKLTGVITTVAGTGSGGFSSDGIPATEAFLKNPNGIAIDGAGNMYIADTGNHRIRKVDTAGNISTVAGNGVETHTVDKEGGDSSDDLGDGGQATLATLSYPAEVAIDGDGNIYIADGSRRIRRVDKLTGIITTVAGNGEFAFNGDEGIATSISIGDPYGVVVDSAGNLYIADNRYNRIRKVDTAGKITTVAGDGTEAFSGDGGSATLASLYYPSGVALDSAGNLYIADADNNRIRKVDTGGTITTIAGTGSYSQLSPSSIAFDNFGNMYITGDNRVQKIDKNGTITTVAGNGERTGDLGDEGPATAASLDRPGIVAFDGDGNLFIAEYTGNRIRKVVPGSDGIFQGLNPDTGEALDPEEIITTVAGNGERNAETGGVFGDLRDDGPATDAIVGYPSGLAFDGDGNMYISDLYNNRIRKVDLAGIITSAVGTGSSSILYRPSGLAFDSAGNLYIADQIHHRIQKVDTDGTITTVAGNGVNTGSVDGEGGDPSDDLGDDGPATTATLYSPQAVAIDGDGNLFISDATNNRVRKVDLAGIITTVAGTGIQTYSVDGLGGDLSDDLGDGGPALLAALYRPGGLAFDSAGILHFTTGDLVRRISTDACPNDPDKILPGACGCGVVDDDTDTDGDGKIDCADECPNDNTRTIRTAANDLTCDNFDDDCDGLIDEDFAPTPVNCGEGSCAATGETTCKAGVEGDSCQPGIAAADDASCDGVDDDCDGTDDEDYIATAVNCGAGACSAAGQTTCINGLEADSCVIGEPAADDVTCDGKDDDCDGTVDEDCVIYLSGSLTDTNLSTPNLDLGATKISDLTDLAVDSVDLTQAIPIVIKEEEQPRVEFNFDFSLDGGKQIDLDTVSVVKQDADSSVGTIAVKGIDLAGQAQQTKTAYVDNIAGYHSLCIKDEANASIADITEDCDGSNETFISCPGREGQYTCEKVDNDSRYKVSGLRHTAITESPPPPSSSILRCRPVQKLSSIRTLIGCELSSDNPNYLMVAKYRFPFKITRIESVSSPYASLIAMVDSNDLLGHTLNFMAMDLGDANVTPAFQAVPLDGLSFLLETDQSLSSISESVSTEALSMLSPNPLTQGGAPVLNTAVIDQKFKLDTSLIFETLDYSQSIGVVEFLKIARACFHQTALQCAQNLIDAL